VTLTKGYYIGVHEATQGQWTALMGVNPAKSWGVGPDHPVYYVSWNDVAGAGGFLAALNAHLAATGQAGAGRFRLPTSAEWERAARAGTTTPFSFGDDPGCSMTGCAACPFFDLFMWWCGNNSPFGAKPVGGKAPNPWGLYDMHGNVGEWVADWEEYFTTAPAIDPQGPASGTYKVARNGNWNYRAEACRSARWEPLKPHLNWSNVGFRVAMSP
jgi:formylglycine-generating enzyme required for sulfatase activity